jgi:hypothetical protein
MVQGRLRRIQGGIKMSVSAHDKRILKEINSPNIYGEFLNLKEKIKRLRRIRNGELRQKYCGYFVHILKIPQTWTEEIRLSDYCTKRRKEVYVEDCGSCKIYSHINRFKGVEEE